MSDIQALIAERNRLDREITRAGAGRPMAEALTPSQLDVAVAIASGRKNSEIAAMLGVSVKTVDTHRTAVMRRLNLRNNVELCLRAVREGLVSP